MGGKKAHKGHQHTAGKAQGDGGLHRFMNAHIVFCAVAAGRHNVCAQRKAHEQVHQQVDQRAVGADSGQRRAACKPAHHNDVRRIEQQLQNAGCRQGQCKQDDLF